MSEDVGLPSYGAEIGVSLGVLSGAGVWCIIIAIQRNV